MKIQSDDDDSMSSFDLAGQAAEIADRQSQWTRLWHDSPTSPDPEEPWASIELNHRMNFDLWHEEDVARRDDLPAERIRDAKRAIDRFNQRRNDAVERIDEWILGTIQNTNPGSPLHSETVGMIVDRLSILSLKLYHMEIEAGRESAEATQRERCQVKASILATQRCDLTMCLDSLLMDLRAGRRQFRLYRQFKMYNDPTLNPQLYSKLGASISRPATL